MFVEPDFEAYEERFVRFIEAVNKIRSATNTRTLGSNLPTNGNSSINSQTKTPVRRKATNTPQSIGRVRPGGGVPTDLREVSTDLGYVTDAWLAYLRKNPLSIAFSKRDTELPNTELPKTELPTSLFVAYDLVAWLRSKFPVISTKRDAISYANMMLQNRRIRLLPVNSENEDNDSTVSSNDSDEAVFHYGFHFYLVVTPAIEQDIAFMADKTQILVKINDFCENDSFSECKFTSRSVPIEITNSTFVVRHAESKFLEWCRVSFFYNQ